MFFDQQPDTTVTRRGTLDGAGAADHDEAYRFGRRPRSTSPYPFSTRQYARLLVLRSRVRESDAMRNDVSAA